MIILYTRGHMQLYRLDHDLIHFFRKITVPTARISLFVVFCWFGSLKLLGLSPAGPLVYELFNQTLSFMNFEVFYALFATFECIIGVLFLIPKTERVAFPLLLLHMLSTALPLILLPSATWQSPFVPTLEGQYIIKNLLIIATAISLMSHLHPLPKKK